MRRRAYLAALAAGTALAGCQGALRGDGNATGSATPTLAPPPTSGAAGETELPVPDSALQRGAPKDAIPAITDPEFAADWSDVVERSQQYASPLPEGLALSDDDAVIGVERDGRARAYPLRVLNWHEVVNDDFGGPLLVTYCPLCGSAVTAERTVGGRPATFGVSGLLYRADLVMYDAATESLWSQILAQAIQGPRTGERLSLTPSSLTTWGAWREGHPDTEVLLPPPVSNTVAGRVRRRYAVDPYRGYERSRRIGTGGREEGGRLHPKTQVVGVTAGDVSRAYPLPAVREAGAVNDTVGDLPVVVIAADGNDRLYAYERRVDGTVLPFEEADGRLVAGGSRWAMATGTAVDGPFEGTTLARANDRSPMFWFAWRDFNPETEVYGDGSAGTTPVN
jgi:hypothetical protein